MDGLDWFGWHGVTTPKLAGPVLTAHHKEDRVVKVLGQRQQLEVAAFLISQTYISLAN
jgi:hypothetical protein